MYAIVETGGKQYKVQEGDTLRIEKLDNEAGVVVDFDKVVAVVNDGQAVFGRPYVEGAKVSAKIAGHGKGDKILVFKYKPKKKYRKLRGHRQQYTDVVVESITTV